MLSVALEPADDLATVEALWRRLESRAQPTFFQSWHWIGAWLRTLPPALDRRLLVVRRGDAVVGMAILVRDVAGRWHLHETGVAALDVPTIEDNGILSEAGASAEVATAVLDWLLKQTSEGFSLSLPGISPALADLLQGWAASRGLACTRMKRSVRPYVDLDRMRNAGTSYLDCLSANTRQAIRRSLRRFEANGAIGFTIAADMAQAETFLSRLKDLHQITWNRRGLPGAFAYPAFEALHADLLRSAMPCGHIQLCRVMAGDAEIGYLYNFLWDNRIHTYQSGFAYGPDKRLKPGLVCHALAIEQALRAGHRVYDFMAGPGQHKESLSTDTDHLYWVTVERMTLTKFIGRRVSQIQRKLRATVGAASDEIS
jgi:CelD/BcsL family acetyltransferase involved in cellulose biosynthesis